MGGRRRKARSHRTSATLDLDTALSLAVQLHRSGRNAEAEALYRRLLQARPQDPDALHFLGVLCHQTQRSAEAVALIRQAIERLPDHADAHSNLGNVLRDLGRYEEAEAAYREAIRLRPDHANAYSNLGVVYHALRRPEDAIAAYRKAIALEPRHAEAYFNLGNVLKQQGDYEAAIDAYFTSVSLKQYSGTMYRNLGSALYAAGRIEQAREIYEKWLREEPNHPVARHMIAACSGEAVPDRCSDDYVRVCFDGFAASFDTELAALGYRAPELLAQLIRDHSPAPSAALEVLDAGCGTGLCGPLLRPYAAHLVGADLSAKMLARARARGSYDELVEAELTQYMAGRRGRFDLIVSADTLIYFGDLRAVLRAAATALGSRGRLAFSLEHAADTEHDATFHLNPHGRYSHGETYVRRALAEAGLRLLDLRRDVVRSEAGKPVQGLIVLAETEAG